MSIVRDISVVRVSGPVNGRRARRSPQRTTAKAGPLHTLTVDPRVMAALVLRPGEHLVIDSATHVHTEYDR